MTYVDGFVIPIKKKNIPAYKKMAQDGKKVWKKYGALDYKECIGNELKSKWGMPFPKLVKLKKGETVIFSYIVYKNKKHRNAVNEKVMKDPFMKKYEDKPMPFDMKRMVYGGFDVIV